MAFIEQLNQLVQNTPLQSKSMEELIMLSYKDPSKLVIYESAAMVWNRSFFWYSMKKNGRGKPTGAIAAKIIKILVAMRIFLTHSKMRPIMNLVAVGLG